MVNPERLHNAAAALDILARADSTAFAAGRADAMTRTPYSGENPWAAKGVKLYRTKDNGGGIGVEAILNGKTIAWSSHPALLHDKVSKALSASRNDADPLYAAIKRKLGDQSMVPDNPASRADAPAPRYELHHARDGMWECYDNKRHAWVSRHPIKGDAEADVRKFNASRNGADQPWSNPEFIVRYVNSAGKAESVKIRAGSAKEAEDKAKRLLGKEVHRVVQVTRNADARQANERRNKYADTVDTRGDAIPKPGTKAHTLAEIERDGTQDGREGLPYKNPYREKDEASAYYAGYSRAVPFKTARQDASYSIAEPRFRAINHGRKSQVIDTLRNNAIVGTWDEGTHGADHYKIARRHANENNSYRQDATPSVAVGTQVKTVYGVGEVVKVNGTSLIVRVNGADHKMTLKQHSIMNDASARRAGAPKSSETIIDLPFKDAENLFQAG